MKSILEGLKVLNKYEPDGSFSAEHDEVYACGIPPEDMSPEDVSTLEGLSWAWDEDVESWHKFV